MRSDLPIADDAVIIEAMDYHRVATTERRSGLFSEAISHVSQAVALLQPFQPTAASREVLKLLGYLYRDTGAFQEAESAFQQVEIVCETLGDQGGLATAKEAIGGVYGASGRLIDAFEHFQEALGLFQLQGDASGVALCRSDIANVYRFMGEYASAIEEYRQVLEHYESVGDTTSMARVLGNLGTVYRETGDFDLAMDHLERALAMHVQTANQPSIARVYGNIGNVLLQSGKPNSAIDYLTRATEMSNTLGLQIEHASFVASLIEAYKQLGEVALGEQLLSTHGDLLRSMSITQTQYYIRLASIRQNSKLYNEAFETLMQCLEGARERGAVPDEMDTHVAIRDLAESMGNLALYVEHNRSYLELLESSRGVQQRRRLDLLEAERRVTEERRLMERQRDLLVNMLPSTIAERLINGETSIVDFYESASVMFIDMVNFTTWTSEQSPTDLINQVNEFVDMVDAIITRHGLTKVKTIGDAYLAVGNAPAALVEHQRATAHAALQIMGKFHAFRSNGLDLRIGLHVGPIVAGVVGTTRTVWDIWGDTVNVASRMESTSEAGRIHVSESFFRSLTSFRDDGVQRHPDGGEADEGPNYTLTERGAIEVKGKGTMQTYWLESTT